MTPLKSHPFASILALGLTLTVTSALGQEVPNSERVEGRIVKVEAAESTGLRRVTINTGVPWRDYARDTQTAEGVETADAAQRGDGSVSTGQPETESSLVTITVRSDTPIRLRYRTLQDERSLGASTAEDARKFKSRAEEGPESDRAELTKGTRFAADQLKDGLYVIARPHDEADEGKIDWLFVIEPVEAIAPDKP